MNSRTMPSLGALAVIAAGALTWYLLAAESNSSSQQPPRRAGASSISPRPDSQRPSYTRPSTPAPPIGTPEFKKRMLECSAAWLASRGRDARGLIAVRALTGEESFLKEALEKYPNDPHVVLAKVRSANTYTPDFMQWIERFIALEPDNPEGLFLKARALTSGAVHRREAVEAVRPTATKQQRREGYLSDYMWTLHEAAVAAGVGQADALRHAFTTCHADESVHVFYNIKNAIRGELEAAKTAGDTAQVAELATLGINIAGKFTAGGPMPMQLELFANQFRRDLLAVLPANAVIESPGAATRTVTAADLRTLTARELADIKTISNRGGKDESTAAGLIASASDAVMLEYFKTYSQSGQRAAWRTLLDTAAGAGN